MLADHHRIHHQGELEMLRFFSHKPNDFIIAQSPGLCCGRRNIFENRLQLGSDNPGREDFYCENPLRILNCQQRDDACSINSPLMKGLQVRLNSRPSRGIGACNGQCHRSFHVIFIL